MHGADGSGMKPVILDAPPEVSPIPVDPVKVKPDSNPNLKPNPGGGYCEGCASDYEKEEEEE